MTRDVIYVWGGEDRRGVIGEFDQTANALWSYSIINGSWSSEQTVNNIQNVFSFSYWMIEGLYDYAESGEYYDELFVHGGADENNQVIVTGGLAFLRTDTVAWTKLHETDILGLPVYSGDKAHPGPGSGRNWSGYFGQITFSYVCFY